MGYYDYEELKAAYVKTGAKEDLDKLADWFQHYGMSYWNGESWDADDFRVFPIYEEVSEDEFEIVGYEAR